MASEMDAETFYAIHRDLAGVVISVKLPAWDELSWEDRLEWEDRYNEQEARDSRPV